MPSDSSSSTLIRDMAPDERPREKLTERGAAALSDAEILAIFFGTGRRGMSAVDLGRELIRKYGSLAEISRRSTQELEQIPGIGNAKATQLSAVFEFGRRLARETFSNRVIDSPEAVYELIGPEMRVLSQESVRLILLDTRSRLIRIAEVTLGSVNECLAHPREIFRPAIAHSAVSFVLVHNHPSGDPSPSRADIQLTKQLKEASDLMKISMQDHVIVGAPAADGNDQPYFSFREMGML